MTCAADGAMICASAGNVSGDDGADLAPHFSLQEVTKMNNRIRAHIRLNSQAEVMTFIQSLSKFNDNFTIDGSKATLTVDGNTCTL